MSRQQEFTSNKDKQSVKISNGNGNAQKNSQSAEKWQQMLYNTIEKLQVTLQQSETIDKEKITAKLKKLGELVINTSLTTKESNGQENPNLEDIYIRAAKQLVQSEDTQEIFQTITKELLETLQCDRVAIYRFNQDWTGEFIAESFKDGWDSLLEKQKEHSKIIQNVSSCSLRDLRDFNRTLEGNRIPRTVSKDERYYTRGETYRVVNDLYKAGFPDSYIRILELYQAKAYIVVAIYQGEQLWGLLAVYQNKGPRNWEKYEVKLVVKLATLFGVPLQQSDYLKKIQQQKEKLLEQAEKDKSLTKILDRIRQSQNLQAIFNVNTSEIRQLLKCDRVVVYQFNPDYTGEVIAESVGSQWVSLIQEQENCNDIVTNINACSVRDLATKYATIPATKPKFNSDTYLLQTGGGNFNFGELYTVKNDVYKANFSSCYLKALEKYQAKAYIIVAIYQERKLWGLLAAYQNSGPREWQSEEIELMVRIANQFSIAIQQQEYLKQIEASNQKLQRRAEAESALTKIADLIRLSKNIEGIYDIVTSEIRQLFKCDRAAIYQFSPKWGGKFIAESVDSSWVSVLEQQENIPKIKANINQCSIRDLASSAGLVGQENVNFPTIDTYFQQPENLENFTQGKLYRVQNDIRSGKLNECYVQSLEAFQARAYIIVAIYQGWKLWGLLAVYQNSGPREWLTEEIELLVKIAERFSLGIQRAEYIKQLEAKNTEISQIAAGEKAIAKLVEQLAEKITQVRGLREIFKSTLTQIRLLLKCDRVSIYKFNPDWSGGFVAESVSKEYPDLVGPGIKTVWEDTYMQETKGGPLHQQRKLCCRRHKYLRIQPMSSRNVGKISNPSLCDIPNLPQQ